MIPKIQELVRINTQDLDHDGDKIGFEKHIEPFPELIAGFTLFSVLKITASESPGKTA
ncbi:hypothetical protein [Methylomicrobium sp. RS1]|uniref:hypothetical protein n=1 Tax=Candidatus Methylomicrobium oryzae TaxID=2802053 RepID=UPI001921A7C5|nr:hypothetical protein [Methylomicrobium sp. RS1]